MQIQPFTLCSHKQAGGCKGGADRLLGHKLFSKSRQLRFADLQHPDKIKRVLKPIKELREAAENNPDSNDIFQMHWVVDIYPDRPDELETASLYDVLCWYEKERLTPDSNVPLQLKYVTFWLQRMTDEHQAVRPCLGCNDMGFAKRLRSRLARKLYTPCLKKTVPTYFLLLLCQI